MSEETAPPAASAAPVAASGARKKRFNPVVVLVPIAVIAALVLAFTLPPTHALIVNGPLKPVLARIGMAPTGPAARARTAATPDPATEIRRLSAELETDRKAEAAKDARIAQLQSEVSDAQVPPAQPSSTPLPKPSASAVPETVKRTGQYWAEMDAEKAADIAKRLPEAYVKLVFSQMPPDAVAEIMNALPAKTAAALASDAVADRQ